MPADDCTPLITTFSPGARSLTTPVTVLVTVVPVFVVTLTVLPVLSVTYSVVPSTTVTVPMMFVAPPTAAPVPAPPVPAAPVPAAPVPAAPVPAAPVPAAPLGRAVAPVAPVVPPATASRAAAEEAVLVAGTLLFSTFTPTKNPATPTARSASTSVANGSRRRRVLSNGGGGGSSISGARLRVIDETPFGETPSCESLSLTPT